MRKVLVVFLCILLIGLSMPLIANALDKNLTKQEIQKEIEEILNQLTSKPSKEQEPLLQRLNELELLLDEINYGKTNNQEVVNQDTSNQKKTSEEIIQEIEILKQELEQKNNDVQKEWDMLQEVQKPGAQVMLPLATYKYSYTEAVKARDDVQNKINDLMNQLEQLSTEEINSIESKILKSPLDKTLYNKAGEIYKKYRIEGIKLFVNGERLKLDIKPFIENGRTLIPLRGICEKLGAIVTWDGDTKTIKISKAKQIIMTIGKKSATIDNQTLTLDIAPKIVDNRTFIPLRFVAENLNSDVSYDGNTCIITINSK